MPPAAAIAPFRNWVSGDMLDILASFSCKASFSIYTIGNMSIHQKIREGRAKLGMTEQQFGDAVGVSRGAVQQWEKEGGTAPTRKNQPAVAKLLGIPVAELMGGDAVSAQPIDLEDNPLYPAIRKVKFKLSAGASGFGVDYENEDHQPIVFGKYWYEVNKLRPEALFAVRVTGSSMLPGLSNGDIVVVNTLSTQPKDETVFAVNYEGEMVIKRLFRDDGDWWPHSDNPNNKRKRMHADCFIIGEVIQKQSMKI